MICALTMLMVMAVPIALMTRNNATVFIGAVVPISYVADDLREGITVWLIGISQSLQS